ncbi:MAG: glycine cleavage system aminomethyltransferase GcvT [Armatimonadetes bacterium]|nr:glycine cleavage system aminomethyltransferase GcvT [Armatimonadota bacterium]
MSDAPVMRRTPLYAAHVRQGARMVPFAGWEMPVQYSGVMDESRSVRERAGAFDISHMGRVRVAGPGALDLLQVVTTNDVGALADGRAQYSLMPNAAGGIRDDVIVYRLGATEYLVVVNAGNADADIALLMDAAGPGTEVIVDSDATCMVAVQGPQAVDLLNNLSAADLAAVPRFGFVRATIGGIPATLCRTGYTGEDGFEIIADAARADDLWALLMDQGITPCGLGARDALRVEAGYPLYGHEIDETTSPVEAGLMWAVKLEKGELVGRSAIAEAKSAGPSRKLMGLVMADRAIPRQGYPITEAGTQVGAVTSGAFAATRGVALGMAYIRADAARAGRSVGVTIRGAEHAATLLLKKDLLKGTA